MNNKDHICELIRSRKDYFGKSYNFPQMDPTVEKLSDGLIHMSGLFFKKENDTIYLRDIHQNILYWDIICEKDIIKLINKKCHIDNNDAKLLYTYILDNYYSDIFQVYDRNYLEKRNVRI